MSGRERPDDDMRAWIQCTLKRRDGRRCFYCCRNFKRRSMRRKTIDHFIPYSMWPEWHIDNLVLACERCNLRKADALPLTLVWLLLAVHGDAARYEQAA